MPPPSDSSTTSSPAAGLFVVPFVAVPVICAANMLTEKNKHAMKLIPFQVRKTFSRFPAGTAAGVGFYASILNRPSDVQASLLVKKISPTQGRHDPAKAQRPAAILP